jgi:hypothetical protein
MLILAFSYCPALAGGGIIPINYGVWFIFSADERETQGMLVGRHYFQLDPRP